MEKRRLPYHTAHATVGNGGNRRRCELTLQTEQKSAGCQGSSPPLFLFDLHLLASFACLTRLVSVLIARACLRGVRELRSGARRHVLRLFVGTFFSDAGRHPSTHLLYVHVYVLTTYSHIALRVHTATAGYISVNDLRA